MTAPSFRRLSASQHVVEGLRNEILSGVLKGGERVLQDSVATRFGVSQTSAREAFRQLEGEGFLRAEPRRGVTVVGLDVADAVELIRLRLALEVQALVMAVPRLTHADLAKARDALTQLSHAQSPSDLIRLNAQFHDALYAPSGQLRTLALIGNLRQSFDRYFRFLCDENGQVPKSQDEHVELLAACEAHDVDKATQALAQHIASTEEALVRALHLRLSP